MRLSRMLAIMDKPKHAQVALYRALELQRLSRSHIDAVSFCWQSMVEASEVFDIEQRRAMKKEILRARKVWQRECATEANATHADLSLQTVWSNDIAAWATNASGEQDYDLVVKSVHYSKTLAHTPLDWQLLRECPVPVLLTSTQKRKRSNNVLVALDLSKLDRAHQQLNKSVLDAASTFADFTGAKLHCVYVVEISTVLRDLDIVDTREARRKAIAKNREAIGELLEPYSVPKSRVYFPVGKVGQSVQQLVRKHRADLLVMGTHAHRFTQSIGIGNSAERILARVPCDVLALHP